MMRYAAACVALLSACGSCAESHGRDDAGGPWDAATPDAPPLDSPDMRHDAGAPLPDGDLPDGTDCSEVAGVRRCGLEQCPYLCPGSPPVRCSNYVPLCLPRTGGGCTYEVGEPTDPPEHCSSGGPCVLPGEGPPESGQAGACLPIEYLDLCLTDWREVDLPPFHCMWTDMTMVRRAPPAATCPPAPDPRAPFCAGACSEVECPAPSTGLCLGLGDSRGFGVCARSGVPCFEDMSPFFRHYLEECARDYDAPCACMVLHPQPPEAPFPRGNIVLADACLAYERAYPEGVECRDADWVRLLP